MSSRRRRQGTRASQGSSSAPDGGRNGRRARCERHPMPWLGSVSRHRTGPRDHARGDGAEDGFGGLAASGAISELTTSSTLRSLSCSSRQATGRCDLRHVCMRLQANLSSSSGSLPSPTTSSGKSGRASKSVATSTAASSRTYGCATRCRSPLARFRTHTHTQTRLRLERDNGYTDVLQAVLAIIPPSAQQAPAEPSVPTASPSPPPPLQPHVAMPTPWQYAEPGGPQGDDEGREPGGGKNVRFADAGAAG